MVAAMLTVKESMLTAGTVAELAEDDEEAAADEPDEVDVLDEDEQPAAAMAAAAPRATQPMAWKRRDLPSPCVREFRPPSLLLLIRILDTLSPGCTRISRPG